MYHNFLTVNGNNICQILFVHPVYRFWRYTFADLPRTWMLGCRRAWGICSLTISSEIRVFGSPWILDLVQQLVACVPAAAGKEVFKLTSISIYFYCWISSCMPLSLSLSHPLSLSLSLSLFIKMFLNIFFISSYNYCLSTLTFH